MSILVTVVHVLVCIFLMLTVLLQSGKGGGMGAAFGGGTSGSAFGGAGAGNVLRKITVVAAALFMLTSMTLAWISSNTSADALRRYSAQQRRAAEVKAQMREKALEGVAPTVPGASIDGTAPGADVPEDDSAGSLVPPPEELEGVEGVDVVAPDPAAQEADPAAGPEGEPGLPGADQAGPGVPPTGSSATP